MTAAVDVNAFVGAYPFRDVPHPDPDVLVRVLDREEIGEAWVGQSAVGVASRSDARQRRPGPTPGAARETLTRRTNHSPRLAQLARHVSETPRERRTGDSGVPDALGTRGR